MSLSVELKKRGLLEAITHPEILNKLDSERLSFYVGFDPSAESFHLGQLAVFRLMSLLQKAGHSPILLIGGSTGCIGDPSGKDAERSLLSKEQIQSNINKLLLQFQKFFDFEGEQKAQIVNNYDWMKDFSYLDFLRDIGKFFPVGSMIAKESVKSRIQGSGITYTEFSYMLLQSYDFYFLSQNYQCFLQLGGSDQWGNIVAGIDLIRRMSSQQAYGLTMPLITKSDGTKFGKSEGNAVWLDKSKTSPFQLYQYLVRSDDEDVIKFLKLLSDLPLTQIANLEKEHQEKPHLRQAHNALAENVVAYVHGIKELEKIKKANQIFYGNSTGEIDDKLVLEIFKDVPSCEIPEQKIIQGWGLVEALTTAGVVDSSNKARKLIASGGVYLNNKQVANIDQKITKKNKISQHFILLRKGKKNYYLIKVS